MGEDGRKGWVTGSVADKFTIKWRDKEGTQTTLILTAHRERRAGSLLSRQAVPQGQAAGAYGAQTAEATTRSDHEKKGTDEGPPRRQGLRGLHCPHADR